jgi:DNA polymerase III subunit chi
MTTRVDFYILDTLDARDRRRFACRLTAKAYLKDLRVIVWSGNESDAKLIDDLLWTFDEQAFVPHQLSRDEELADRATPVHVALGLGRVDAADLLVNLTDRLPEGLTRFARVAEIIDADPERRRLGRERFKAYRDGQLTLETHQLGAGAEA